MKVKAKSYADRKRHAEYSDLVPGNRVLVKQEKQNKLSTPFAPEPYDVVGRNGSSFTIKSTKVVWLKRNTVHVKKYVQEDVQAESPNLTRLSATYLETDGGKEKNAISKRPALTDLETDCGKFRTATDDDHLQDQLVKRSYQRTLSVLAQMSGGKGDVSTWQNAFGGEGTLGIEWAIAMTMQPSLTKMKTLTACKQALWDKSQANKMREQGAGKESESSLCPPPPTASPLTRMFACHLKWRGCSQFITFLGNRACLVFGEPDYFRNSEKNFVHVSFFTQFNQHLTINNITALTCARLKESWHKCDIRTPKCMLQ